MQNVLEIIIALIQFIITLYLLGIYCIIMKYFFIQNILYIDFTKQRLHFKIIAQSIQNYFDQYLII